MSPDIAKIRKMVTESTDTLNRIRDPKTAEEHQAVTDAEDSMGLVAILSLASLAESMEQITRQLHALTNKP